MHEGRARHVVPSIPTPAVLVLATLTAAACASRVGPAPDATRAAEPAPRAGPADHDHGASPADAPEHAGAHRQLPATAGPGYTEADVRFMQHMIGHHAQALVMAAMAPERGAGERLLRLARKIEISQRDEIAFMQDWLMERGQVVPNEHDVHAMHMPGMLTAEELARLEAARGPEFERLFLTFMIRHHEGALDMVASLFASPGAGQDPDIFRFATDVDADQRDEILVMQRMLEELVAKPRE
jgi:uncharacterized protein (DUF305 family)